MSDLITREEAQSLLLIYDVSTSQYSDIAAIIRSYAHGDLIHVDDLVRQTRHVAGQNADGTFNGKDYIEERFVTGWDFCAWDTDTGPSDA